MHAGPAVLTLLHAIRADTLAIRDALAEHGRWLDALLVEVR